MLRHSGKAAVEVGHAVHRVCGFLLTLMVILSVGAVGVAWRLSRGPVDLGFLKDRVEAAVNNGFGPIRVTIGGASIAWGGFSHGLDQPLILRFTDLRVEEAAGAARVQIPIAEATLSVRWLLLGRVLPRTITLEGARLVLIRAIDGSVSFGLDDAGDRTGPSPLDGLLAVLGTPAETDRQAGGGRLSQLSAISIRSARLSLSNRVLGLALTAERADVDFSRRRGGGMDGHATLLLAMGEQKSVLSAKFALAAGARSAHVAARLSQMTPKALATSAPILAPLAALDAPLSLDGEADLGPDFIPTNFRVIARAGAGKINTDTASIPIRRAEVIASGTLEQATLESAVVELRPTETAAISTLGGSGSVIRRAGRLAAMLRLTLDRVAFADLPTLWPADIGSNARAWIVQNIQAGTARDGRAEFVLEAPDDASDVTLLSASATLEGDDVAVTWLPTVPRVEQARAHVVLTDPDKVEIDVRSGRQRVNGGESIAVQNGHVTVTGLTKKDQFATIRCDATGSVPSTIALLKEPRLRILDRHPIDLRQPAGDVRVNLQVAVPLLLGLRFDDVTIHGAGTISKAHLSGIAAGRDLDDGMIGFDVDANRLTIKGTARLAGISSTIDGMMDFRAGPPSQVTQRYTVTARPGARALADAGLDTGDVLAGEIGLNAVLSEFRNGGGELVVEADLTPAALTVAPLAWRKPAGGAATGTARLILSKDKLTGIDRLALDGAGIQVRGSISAVGGKLDVVRLDRAVIGRTDVKGTIRLPRIGPIGVDIAGPALDISSKLLEKLSKRDPTAAEPPAGPAWSMRGRFDRVFLARDQIANQVTVEAEHDGRLFRGLLIAGSGGGGKPFSMQIGQGQAANGRPVRRVTIDAADAGNLLGGLDITDTIQGGALTVAGDFNDTTRDHTLSGTLELTDFRVTRAPALGKLLQAVTLYGLVDALSGPGLSFTRLTAPFQFNDDMLMFHDAMAFSPSLGLTAKGRIDRNADRLDVQGTLVPAYVFNSLLGRIPFIGGLFSVEKGGGLFAMNYSLRGPADNPTIAANPLSVVTPGILRGMFGMFDRAPSGPRPAGPQPPLDRETSGGNAQQP